MHYSDAAEDNVAFISMTHPIKVQLNDLISKREDIEADVSLRSERLTVAGVGLEGSLLDNEVGITVLVSCQCLSFGGMIIVVRY